MSSAPSSSADLERAAHVERSNEAIAQLIADVRRETFEACAQRCEMIDEYMGPRFCADQIRRMARSARSSSQEKDR